MRCKSAVVLLFLYGSNGGVCWPLSAQETQLPELIIPPPEVADVSPTESNVAATGVAADARREMPPEAIEFIRTVALLLIPHEFADDDDWGNKTRVQSGLNMRLDDGQLKTSRRWKHVNHGDWRQASGMLVNPDETFRLRAAGLPDPEQGTRRYAVDVAARLRVTGRQQQWSYGLMLWSISAEAIADVDLHLVLDVKSDLVQSTGGTKLRFLPQVREAEVNLTDFNLRRISHLKGKPVQEIGDWFEKLIRKRVSRENKKLAVRLNTVLEKKPERLEVPFDVAGWFLSGMGKEDLEN